MDNGKKGMNQDKPVRGYREDIEIDDLNLVEEWKRQPTLYLEYGEKKAFLDKRRNSIKSELDVLKAQVAKKMRSGEVQVEKTTDKAIEQEIIAYPEVIAKEKELAQAAYEASVMSSVVEAFSQRKKALEKLSDLFVFGYNAEPKSGRVDHIREVKKQRERNTKENIQDSLVDGEE